jgi:hypothetical protein
MANQPASNVFLTYRRQDAGHLAGRLYDRLVDRLGQSHVFMDVDSIDPGSDYHEAIRRAVGVSDVVLALIGQGWVSAHDEHGRPRLEDPVDLHGDGPENLDRMPAVLAGAGVPVGMSDLFGAAGLQLLARVELAPAARGRVNSMLRLIENVDFEVELFAKLVAARLREHPGYQAIQHPRDRAGAGRGVRRRDRRHRPVQPARPAGQLGRTDPQTPRVRHHRTPRPFTKMGCRLVRWAAVEAVQRVPAHTSLGQIRDQVGACRGRNIGVVAAN